MIDCLIQAAVPGISDEALLAAAVKRDQQVMEVHESTLALQEDPQAVENILEHEDVQDIRKSARATARHMATKEAAAKKGTPPPSETAAPTVVVEKKLWNMRPFPEDTHWDIATAREHLPKCKGCKLAKDVNRFCRWSAECPNLVAPRVVMKAWVPKTRLSCQQALEYVLQIVWQWHTTTTEVPCPHDWTPAEREASSWLLGMFFLRVSSRNCCLP